MNYSVFDNMIEGIQIINDEWDYIYVNDAIIINSKTTKKNFLNSTLMEVYPEIEHTEMFGLINKCMKERVACKAEYLHLNSDGSKGWIDLRVEPIDDSLLIMSNDITEKNQHSTDRLHFEDLLENLVNTRTKELTKNLKKEVELNSKKSAFVSIASHEFRTPLSSILLSTNLIELYMLRGDNANCQKHIKRIEQSVCNLTYILDEFVSIDGLEQGKVKAIDHAFDLKEFLENLISVFEGIQISGQSIHLTYTGMKEVVIDEKILLNIMNNLLSNAMKYSDEIIEVDVHVSKTRIKIAIKDNGIGIPENQQKKMFQKFFRASNVNQVQGSGLGLSIVKYYVSLLKGSINFTSTEGEGSTFTLDFANKKIKDKTI